jgi:hypothetical protein
MEAKRALSVNNGLKHVFWMDNNYKFVPIYFWILKIIINTCKYSTLHIKLIPSLLIRVLGSGENFVPARYYISYILTDSTKLNMF